MTPEQAIATANARLRLSQANAAPEQGNMYTQSAEDIQYDPMSGVPLNTSSYGSETKGGTDYARKALTTAAALPVNVATGVAKNVGGLAQTVNRYFGGESSKGNLSKPEEFINAINQIETGTQQQAGSPNLLKGASMVGQAAPWFATGGVGGIPSYLNAAKNIGTGAAIGGASALATPEEVGMTPEEFRAAKNKNIAIQSTLGGVLPAGGELIKMLRGTKPSAQVANVIENARETGYTMLPTQAGGGIFSQALEGLAGKTSTAQAASVKNQQVTDKLAIKALGLPEDSILSPELIKSVRDTAGQAYENLKLSGTVKTSPKFIQALDEIKPYKDAVQAAKDFPDELANPIIKTIESLKRPNFDVNSAVSKINLLRNEADVAFRQGNSALGKANKDASKVLENTIENHLANTKQTDLLDKFREARTLIAKTYEVEKAMNKTTGSVEASKLGSRLQAGKPMSGELKDIAQFAQTFPKAVQTPEKVAGVVPFTPLDAGYATLAGGSALLGGQDYGSTGALTLAALLARPGARKLALSRPVQNSLVTKATQPGAIRQALPSPEETRQLAKMLLMQRIGGTSEKNNE